MKRQTDKRITFFCSDTEGKLLFELARRRNTSMSNYLKLAINNLEQQDHFEIRKTGAREGGLAKAAKEKARKAQPKIKPSQSPWEKEGYFRDRGYNPNEA